MNSLPTSKEQLRAALRQRRQSISPDAQAIAAEAVAIQAASLPRWESAQRVAIYHAADGEVNTSAIAKCCHNQGKDIFLPVISADTRMFFAQWREGDELIRNRFGIPEPAVRDSATTDLAAGPSLCPVAKLDILFIPLVGWDAKGGRLGMGAGYYDRALKGVNGPVLVGLAHKIQEVKDIPQDPWDVPLDAVITAETVYQCRKKNS